MTSQKFSKTRKVLADHDYVVAQEAELEGTIRVFTPEIRKQTKARLEALAKSIAEVYGGTAEVEWKDFTSPLINDPAATAEAQKTAVSLFGEEKVIRQRQPALGGDDFAEYILCAPAPTPMWAPATRRSPIPDWPITTPALTLMRTA